MKCIFFDSALIITVTVMRNLFKFFAFNKHYSKADDFIILILQSDYCSYLYEVIRNHKKDDGTLLCDTLIRVPKRRQDPAYYEVVSNPIDLLKIQQKVKTDEYEDIEDMATDVELMVNNAKSFYKVIFYINMLRYILPVKFSNSQIEPIFSF